MSIAKEFGSWLRKFSWTHFVTLTFAKAVSRASAKRQAVRYFTDMRLIKAWASVVEKAGGGLVHCHALLRGRKLSVRTLEQTWRRGRVRAETYDPALGAAFYLTKAMDNDPDLEWDLHLPGTEQGDDV